MWVDNLHQVILDAEEWKCSTNVSSGNAIMLTGQKIPINEIESIFSKPSDDHYIVYFKLKSGKVYPYMATDTLHHTEMIKEQLLQDIRSANEFTVLRGDNTCAKLKLQQYLRNHPEEKSENEMI